MEIRGGNSGTHLTKLPELQGSIRRQRSRYFQTWWNHTQKRRLYNQPLVHIKILNNELCSLREEEKDVLAFITMCALCLYVFSVSHMYVCGCTHMCGSWRSTIDVILVHSPLCHWALEGYSSSVTCVFHEVLRWELGFWTRSSCALIILTTELFPSPVKYILRKAFDKGKCRFILEKNGQLWNLGDDVPISA